MQPELLLRDIHRVPAPPWWPPAPGWWLLLAAAMIVAAVAWIGWRRRRLRRIAIERLFDEAMADAADAPAQVAAMSALLRRAGRRHRADADTLDDDAWLAALDEGAKLPRFQSGIGRLLIEGVYRRDIDAAELDVLRGLARARFLEWMGAAR